jgi:DEAD/DEAH box helicase domain-containing protein
VYLHRGESYVVDALELDGFEPGENGVEPGGGLVGGGPVGGGPAGGGLVGGGPVGGGGLALVHAEDPDWTTSARSVVEVWVTDEPEPGIDAGGVQVRLGGVTVSSQVVSYLRRRPSGEIIDTVHLDMPEQTLRTRAVWYAVEESLLVDAGLDVDTVPGALHAAEHAAIGLLPLFAVRDRWDIGGMSTALHPDTGLPTVFIYDGHPGGAGFAERGFADVVAWLTATRNAIRDCECPSCVQSPKCGNGNDPLDKPGAVVVLGIVLRALAAGAPDPGGLDADPLTSQPTTAR